MASKQPVRGHNDYFPIIERHLTPHEYELIACGDDAPTPEEVESVGSEFGVRFPDDFIDFSVSRIGGLYVAVKEELWPRPKAWDVGEFWSFLYGMYVFGFGPKVPDFMSIRVQTPAFREHSQTDLVPCLQVVSDANLYGFDRTGLLHQWDHETGECLTAEKTFIEALEFGVAALAQRKAQKLKEKSHPSPG